MVDAGVSGCSPVLEWEGKEGEGVGGGGGRREGRFVRFVSLVRGDQRGGSGGVVDTHQSQVRVCVHLVRIGVTLWRRESVSCCVGKF